VNKAVALANNDVVLIAWSYEEEIPGCLGFAIERREASGSLMPLPAWVGFRGESNPDWKPKDTTIWPVQKFFWRDLTATWGQTYSYEIVPMVGEPGQLTSAEDLRLVTNEVTLTPARSANVSAYFNRGILSTQALAHALPKTDSGAPSGTELVKRIKDADDPIRKALAGQIIQGLSLLLKATARDDSRCHGALYELNDPEMVRLLDDPEHVSLVLANAGSSDDPDATNEASRALLRASGVEVSDRMMTSGHIGHNKFLVKLAPDGTPLTIMSGSTNWTHTGLCAQANNVILLTDRSLAEAYLDFWSDLKAESPTNPPGKATQSDALRAENDAPHRFTVDGAEVTFWRSPNTQRHTKPKDPPAPSDMAEVFELIAGAKQGVLFLLFQPGSPSILDAIGEAEAADPKLFVRGAATDPEAIEKYEALLYHRTGEKPEVAAAAVPDDPIGSMQKELLKTPGAHAIIHDKIVVIDPRSDDCVVVTGSHNLGYKASYANDENMLIVKGHRALAEAYATHVMDIYDHYRWRWRVHQWEKENAAAGGGAGKDSGSGGLATDDGWQAKYFADEKAQAERSFWL
jgi:hypothetical protein